MPHKSYPLMQSLHSPARLPSRRALLFSACDAAGVISVPFVEGVSRVDGGRCRRCRNPHSPAPAGRHFWRNEPKKLNDFNTYLITV